MSNSWSLPIHALSICVKLGPSFHLSLRPPLLCYWQLPLVMGVSGRLLRAFWSWRSEEGQLMVLCWDHMAQ